MPKTSIRCIRSEETLENRRKTSLAGIIVKEEGEYTSQYHQYHQLKKPEFRKNQWQDGRKQCIAMLHVRTCCMKIAMRFLCARSIANGPTIACKHICFIGQSRGSLEMTSICRYELLSKQCLQGAEDQQSTE